MRELIFLVHRIPYPPDKGDKIRSWNILRHLARSYRVHLGCFIDETRDWQFENNLREICAECCFLELDRTRAGVRSIAALWRGLPLTLPYYRDRRMTLWLKDLMKRRPITMGFAYCSAMAQYLQGQTTKPIRRVVDLVDLDSQKWLEYGARASPLKRWILNREGHRLAAAERQIGADFDAVLLSSPVEMQELCELAPELRGRVHAIPNGVDSEYFSPDHRFDNPYRPGQIPIVFTGAMDYWPNVDAITHFAQGIFPAVRERIPSAILVVVGSNPRPEILALTDSKCVRVTGRVDDVRPYTAHARVIIAPLRIARGIQNKVLEGMAIAKPVVASPEAVVGINVKAGQDLLIADGAAAFANAICEAATEDRGRQIGTNARHRVLADYTWSGSLQRLDRILGGDVESLNDERLSS